MNAKKNLTTGIFAILVLSISFIFIMQSIANAEKVCHLEELKVVRISGESGEKGSLNVTPKTLDLTVGDCVVWVNWSKGPEIMVVFQEGKVCYDVARPTGGFKLTEKNCYVTNFIPYGGTSSLTFKDEGVFQYEVITESGQAIKCKLTVHKAQIEQKK